MYYLLEMFYLLSSHHLVTKQPVWNIILPSVSYPVPLNKVTKGAAAKTLVYNHIQTTAPK